MILKCATNAELARVSGVSEELVKRLRLGDSALVHNVVAVQQALEKGTFKFKKQPPFKGGHPRRRGRYDTSTDDI